MSPRLEPPVLDGQTEERHAQQLHVFSCWDLAETQLVKYSLSSFQSYERESFTPLRVEL